MAKHREITCTALRTETTSVNENTKQLKPQPKEEKVSPSTATEREEIEISDDDDTVCPELPMSMDTRGAQKALEISQELVDLCSDDESGSDDPSKGETVDKELLRVYEEVDISFNTIQQLKKLGITNLVELLKRQDDLKTGALASVKKHTQRRLYHFCLWHVGFYTEHAPDVAWQGCFDDDDDLLVNFEKELLLPESPTSELSLPILFEHAKNMLHDCGTGSLNSLPDHQYQLLYNYATKKVYNNMPHELKDLCHFPIEEFISKIIKAIFNFPTGKPSKKTFVVHGRTQAGKTAFNALMVVLSETLECLLLTTTQGAPEAVDLGKKIRDYLGDSTTGKGTFKHFGAKVSEVWVAANTGKQIEAAVKDIKSRRRIKPNGRFWVLFDEADTIFRTKGGDQRTEKAIKALMRLGPCVRILLSATSVPSMLACLEEKGVDTEILHVGTAEDYYGIDDMKPLEDESGNAIYLDVDAISGKGGVGYSHVVEHDVKTDDKKPLFLTGKGSVDTETNQRFPSCEDSTFIPYTSRDVIHLFSVALSKGRPSNGKKGILILDCTATLVNVGFTIFDKAACIQNHFHSQGKPMVVVVFVGQKVHVRRPGYVNGRVVDSKKKTLQEVLEQLDLEFGLSMPFAVFGYNKMRRCISYRTNKRVPTHMILKLGKGHSNDNYVQALGRGSGNFRTALEENGHDHVTLLSDRSDFLMATSYENFCPEVQQRQEAGQSLLGAFYAHDGKFSDSANFLQHGKRKVGQRKDFRSKCPGQDAFEAPNELDSNSTWTSLIIQGVLRAVRDLVLEGGNNSFTVGDIKAKYCDTYQKGDLGISQHQLNVAVRKLLSKEVIRRCGKDARGLLHYAVNDVSCFDNFINMELDYHFSTL